MVVHDLRPLSARLGLGRAPARRTGEALIGRRRQPSANARRRRRDESDPYGMSSYSVSYCSSAFFLRVPRKSPSIGPRVSIGNPRERRGHFNTIRFRGIGYSDRLSAVFNLIGNAAQYRDATAPRIKHPSESELRRSGFLGSG